MLGANGGSVVVGAYTKNGAVAAGLTQADCAVLSSNATNQKVQFKSGANFGKLIAQNVTLKLTIKTAIVYTIGWTT